MEPVAFYKHNIGPEEIASLLETLEGIFLTTGPKTRTFEEKFASYLGLARSLGVTSWTAGAFLVLKAWDVSEGDEVIVPAMTFISTANIAAHCGARPVFVDSEPETGCLDPGRLEKAITPRTRAVIPVHLYGQMCDMKAIRAIADKHGVKVLEDAAHCIEGRREDYGPGLLSDAACFSFYATKNITCGEGGAIASNDEELIEELTRLRLHGMSQSAADRYSKKYRHWDMELLGYKANMSDIQAALLLHQLETIEEKLARKEEICRRYEEAFSGAGIDFPRVRPDSRSGRQLFTIWTRPGLRDDFLAGLQAKGIGVAVNFRAVHLLKYYRETYGWKRGDFPTAEAIGDRTLTLPLYPRLTDEEVERVIEAVLETDRELAG